MERQTTISSPIERKVNIPRSEPSEFIKNSISTSKYNLFTFLPKNLWYQFQKLANVYFLIVAILQVIPSISVSNGVPNILLPLIFVLAVSALKDCLEDLNRRKSDNEENNRKTLKRSNGEWTEVKWKKIRVGDVVKVMKNEYFPADLVLVSSSEPSGLCYIETKNLDGETDLKHKLCNRVLYDLLRHDEAFDELNAQIICEVPNQMIYQFKGKIEVQSREIMLSTEQFLLRGSSLRNAEWIIGIIVYSGHETKVMLNSSKSQNKFSSLETRMNSEIVYVFLLQVIICLLCALIYLVWYSRTKDDTDQYLNLEDSGNDNFVMFILIFFTWMLIFTNFVPISLIVTLECVKFVQGVFISWDRRMYCEATDIPAGVQSLNLNEELGQINYVFSDKTGTLTCNRMEFRKFCINGVSYGLDERQNPLDKPANVDFVDPSFDETDSKSQAFLIHLAVCHSVVTETGDSFVVEYKASSPDELALVSAARAFGVAMLGRDSSQSVLLSVHGESQTYEILNIIEFSSSRKRMSVVCRSPSGQIFIFCKGADTVLYQRLASGQPNIGKSWEYLETYASEGLRTLVLGTRELTEQEYKEWNVEYIEAMSDIQNREKKLEEVYEKIESKLILTGITAVEDKLQENVPSTIAFMREAGIKLWVLTGDKIETAINIGFSSALLTNEMTLSVIEATSETLIKSQLKQSLISSSNLGKKFALIISGDSLLRILKFDLVIKLVKITKNADVVLACRVSPQQKAELVKLVRETDLTARTLSIGDGANDVNMILAAHVGVGIAGLEGNQAVRAADYSIGQFSFLKTLLFTHGHECYRRNANLICYNFYKNALITFPLFYFGVFSAFSGQLLYNMWTYQFFNVTFASFPIMIYAIFDKDKHYDELEYKPKLYKVGIKDKLFKSTRFWFWFTEAILEALAITAVALYAICYASTDHDDGKMMGMWEVSELIYFLVVIVCNIRVLLFSTIFYWFSVLIVILSILSYPLISLFMTKWLPIKDYLDNFDCRGVTIRILKAPNTYAVIVLIIIGIFIVPPFYKHFNKLRKYYKPKSLYEQLPDSDNDSKAYSDDEVQPNTYTPLLNRRHTGFAFSSEANYKLTDLTSKDN